MSQCGARESREKEYMMNTYDELVLLRSSQAKTWEDVIKVLENLDYKPETFLKSLASEISDAENWRYQGWS